MPSHEEDTESELRALIGTTVVGKYRVDRLIGRGGMGAVFQATNLAIGKRVALKFLDHDAARNGEACLRFQREAEAASMAESAHIVQIFDSGVSEAGLPFLVMELLTGEDLRARLRRERRLSVPLALGIVSQILRALLRAHEAGIVHRDLKPDNVFLCARDDDPSFVKIVDFGISKVARARSADTLTSRGTVLGTAFYMSPEQAQSFSDIDGRTDLFSVGALLFEMLCGHPPHSGRTYEAVLIAICTNDAVDVRTQAPDVPEPVAKIVSRALERDRARRFQTAAEFLSAIAELEQNVTTDGPFWVTPSVGEASLGRGRVADSPPRKRYGTFVWGLVATVAGFGLTAYLVGRGRAPQGAERGPAPEPSAQLLPVAAASEPIPVTPQALTPPVPLPAVRASAPPVDKPRRTVAPKPSAHIASGLTLSTKEP